MEKLFIIIWWYYEGIKITFIENFFDIYLYILYIPIYTYFYLNHSTSWKKTTGVYIYLNLCFFCGYVQTEQKLEGQSQ